MRPEDRIRAKLDACRPQYQRLVELRPALADPKASWIPWAAAERSLQLALECAIDVGETVISWKRLPRPEEDRDVFRILGESGVLEPELAARLAKAAGLRNILVHRYGEIDPQKLRSTILHDLKDLEAFAVHVEGALGNG